MDRLCALLFYPVFSGIKRNDATIYIAVKLPLSILMLRENRFPEYFFTSLPSRMENVIIPSRLTVT